MPAAFACPKCSAPWPATAAELALLTACPACGKAARVTAFPALFRPAATTAAKPAEQVLSEGEASCFYHPAKRAVVPCGGCGRFLCALCDVKLGDRSLCPSCIEAGRTKGRLTELEPSRTLWDTSALVLAVVPLILCYPISLLTAPAAVVVALVGRKKPSSVIPRGRWRLWTGLILAVLQILGWLVLVGFFIAKGGPENW
jgi:hypothetical protein